MKDCIYLSHVVWLSCPLYTMICWAAPAARELDSFMFRIANIRVRYKIALYLLWLYVALTMPTRIASIVLFRWDWVTFGLLMVWLVGVIASTRKLTRLHVPKTYAANVMKAFGATIAACVIWSMWTAN